MSLDRRALRDALGQYPTGVAVVTAASAGDRVVGMTMNSFASVSLDPPLVLFSIARSAHSLGDFRAAPAYGINILAFDQEALAERFARPLTDKWGAVEYRRGHGGAPLLAGAAAQFECDPYATHDGGDHVIFVCRVAKASADLGRAPLAFHRGRYGALDQGVQREAGWPLPMHY